MVGAASGTMAAARKAFSVYHYVSLLSRGRSPRYEGYPSRGCALAESNRNSARASSATRLQAPRKLSPPVFKRFGPPVLVTLLVVATGIAFVVTERLKLEPPAITSTRVTKQFSPTCLCNTSKARVAFSLRRSEQVTLLIISPRDGEVREVRQLLDVWTSRRGRFM